MKRKCKAQSITLLLNWLVLPDLWKVGLQKIHRNPNSWATTRNLYSKIKKWYADRFRCIQSSK